MYSSDSSFGWSSVSNDTTTGFPESETDIKSKMKLHQNEDDDEGNDAELKMSNKTKKRRKVKREPSTSGGEQSNTVNQEVYLDTNSRKSKVGTNSSISADSNDDSHEFTTKKKTKKNKKIKEEPSTSDRGESGKEKNNVSAKSRENYKKEPVSSDATVEIGINYENVDVDNVTKQGSKKKKRKRESSENQDDCHLQSPPRKSKKYNDTIATDDKLLVQKQLNNIPVAGDSGSTSDAKNKSKRSNSFSDSDAGENIKESSQGITTKIKFEKDVSPITYNNSFSEQHSHNNSASNRKDSSSSCKSQNERISAVANNLKKSTRKSYPMSKSDQSEMQHSQSEFLSNTTFSKKVKKFLEKNPQLTPVTVEQDFDHIEEKDQVWIVKCPNDLNHLSLKDMDITMDRKIKLKIDGTTYEGILDENVHRTAVLLPSRNQFEIKDISPEGVVTFRKRIPKVDAKEIHVVPTRDTFIPLPETKKRHPLFGPKFSKLVHLPSDVVEKLSDASKRKKVKSKNKEKINEVRCKVEDEPVDDEAQSKKKKKRKRKHSEDQSEEVKTKKLKNDPEVWGSEKAIEDSLFNF